MGKTSKEAVIDDTLLGFQNRGYKLSCTWSELGPYITVVNKAGQEFNFEVREERVRIKVEGGILGTEGTDSRNSIWIKVIPEVAF
ncbi:hypothetical protein [Olivibacter domesticus]|uniref:Uncharacterized protein n=1 Tax=Olivibacter domesticus TaxID=407022 RepID=A0A1H7IBH8_OLID1|nr:hypothetical protein [Olivibacter domesticus]SEK59913.1 hypothetical protein SAMN05661044_00649 [Olivibacter domesticus]